MMIINRFWIRRLANQVSFGKLGIRDRFEGSILLMREILSLFHPKRARASEGREGQGRFGPFGSQKAESCEAKTGSAGTDA